tara:strand:- start:979 stop:1254 length:276 start_codon:yes stop_codon:yes gene_type:complete
MTEEKLVYAIFNCTYKNGENEYKEKWTERLPAEQLDSFLRDDDVLADYIGFPEYDEFNNFWTSKHRLDVILHFGVKEISETLYDVFNKFNI